MQQNLILFTGGVLHPFEDAAPALAGILRDVGFEVRISYEMPEILEWLRIDGDALLVIYALRWSMTQSEKYAQDRARWSFHLPVDAQKLIAAHVASGAGLLGIHTASLCFDDWPHWGEVLGGAWQWGTSHHPPLGPVQARLDTRHFLARGLDDFALNDEVYSELKLAPAVDVFAWATAVGDTAPAQSPRQPACWTHRYGRGRVVYDSLGHDAASLRQPQHARLVQRAALWANRAPAQSWENI